MLCETIEEEHECTDNTEDACEGDEAPMPSGNKH